MGFEVFVFLGSSGLPFVRNARTVGLGIAMARQQERRKERRKEGKRRGKKEDSGYEFRNTDLEERDAAISFVLEW